MRLYVPAKGDKSPRRVAVLKVSVPLALSLFALAKGETAQVIEHAVAPDAKLLNYYITAAPHHIVMLLESETFALVEPFAEVPVLPEPILLKGHVKPHVRCSVCAT